MKTPELTDYLVQWIINQVQIAKADGCVVGISGGLDSAVVGALLTKAFPDDCLGVWMPCESDPVDAEDAKKLAAHFNLPLRTVFLTMPYDSILNELKEKSSANLKARLRMAVLYDIASRNNYLVTGTGNMVEYKLGYFTKWGDGACDIAPLQSLVKREVYELARYLGVPSSIIDKAPSAGLWSGQTDEEEIGVTYTQMDALFTPPSNVDDKTAAKLLAMARRTKHKREPIPAPTRYDISNFMEVR